MTTSKATDLINSYRTIDVHFGALETTLRVRHELLLTRQLLATAKLVSIQSPIILCLTAAAGGTPLLYSIIPADSGRTIWISCFVLVLVLILIKLAFDFWACTKDVQKIKKLMPHDKGETIDQKAWFVQAKVSMYGTRLSAVSEILAADDLTDAQRQKFLIIKTWWDDALHAEEDDALRLKNCGHFSDEEYRDISKWISQARS